MIRRVTLLIVTVALAAGAAWWYLGRSAAPRAVVLIVVDTLRADRLSCYGYDGIETANIDALSRRGVQFENAITVGSWTIPSMGAMMTSLYPTQLGLVEKPIPGQRFFKVRERREQMNHTLDESFLTMAEAFADAGHHTAAFVNQPVLTNQDGYRQGFQQWFRAVSADSVFHVEAGEDGHYDKAVVADDVFRADSVLVETFLRWIPSAPRENLFVWVHLLTPHWPYRPPARYGVAADATPSQLYDGEVDYTDDMVGQVLAAIDAHIGLGNTLVVLTSDHGEEFGERGSKDHGHSLHRECVNVPLLVAGPGIEAGRRVDGYVRLIDLFPTIAARCGVDIPGHAQGSDLLSGAADGHGLPVYSEGMLYGSTERSLIDGGLRIMWEEQDDTYRLFDAVEDRAERHDISGDRPGDTTRMKDALIAFHERLRDDYVRIARDQLASDSLATAEERARALKAMRSLGYVND